MSLWLHIYSVDEVSIYMEFKSLFVFYVVQRELISNRVEYGSSSALNIILKETRRPRELCRRFSASMDPMDYTGVLNGVYRNKESWNWPPCANLRHEPGIATSGDEDACWRSSLGPDGI